jgi:uncharacterized glyoxalase superfamily protein PhnB
MTELSLSGITPTLTVDDMSVSLTWYTEILGFEVTERFDDADGKPMGASLRSGHCNLFLGQDDWSKGRDRDKGAGVRFYFETTSDIDALAAAIEERGGVLDHPPTDRKWGSRDFELTDPSGFKLSFSTPFSG